ncbi:LacI family DNA-binding transcriptional regulator [Mesorhizobium sp. ESP6-5]|uniref:LacI family DNA-binding transcriptional regulator n=1 Tax=unclassified Mesorhizobium TaxID=325217 RepID=UPI0015E27077|nr:MULTISPECIES: LacI family DNA-binding transcriptional regulator [unclassified Mesorhizobium]MBZ9755253.1 LacI family DNA-binding transcriptional regulator [Mesorhizobium sp. ESP6-5]
MSETTDQAIRKRRKAAAKPKGRVTMTDIARAAGCSQATVSFVLNNSPGIRLSRQTRERVIEAARALGYSAPAFSALKPVAAFDGPAFEGLDGVIGFAVDQLATSPEAVVAIEGARQASWNAGNVLLVAQTMGDAVMEPRAISALTRRGISALIYMTIFTREITAPDFLYGLDIPVILLNCYTADYAFPAVVPSEIAGGQSSTRHLISHGHRRIATITGEPWMQAAQDRLKGYRRALATADIPFDPELVVEGDWSASAGYAATVKLLALKDRPTAIFCQNDRTAIGCYEALKEAGLHIPADISVVGYDDEEIARHLFPPLTTSILPHMAMGQWAIEQLEAPAIVGRGRHPITKLECPLVERESVAAFKGVA